MWLVSPSISKIMYVHHTDTIYRTILIEPYFNPRFGILQLSTSGWKNLWHKHNLDSLYVPYRTCLSHEIIPQEKLSIYELRVYDIYIKA